jgi:peptidoglycan/xylan/chitin deacetylase (PgdA/CDA1 family)
MKLHACLFPVLSASALLLIACGPSASVPPPTAPVPRDTIVSITFDDGNADNLAAAEVLDQFGLRATWYIPSGLVGTPGYMTWNQLQSLQAAGHEIGGHSLEHTRLDGLSTEALRHQVCDDRLALQARGFKSPSFAYPFGAYDPAAKQMVQECGYLSARTIGVGPDSIPPFDPFELRAYPYIVNDTSFSKLQRYVSGVRTDGGGWLVLIFHHVCDDCDFFAASPAVWQRFIPWLAEEQAQGRVKIRTVGEVVLNGAP